MLNKDVPPILFTQLLKDYALNESSLLRTSTAKMKKNLRALSLVIALLKDPSDDSFAPNLKQDVQKLNDLVDVLDEQAISRNKNVEQIKATIKNIHEILVALKSRMSSPEPQHFEVLSGPQKDVQKIVHNLFRDALIELSLRELDLSTEANQRKTAGSLKPTQEDPTSDTPESTKPTI